MKYCPKCETRYEEEIIRFCTKDGTPLVNEEEPNFIGMPSEGIAESEEDDPNEVTVVRRNNVPIPPSIDDIDFEEPEPPKDRIVVPTVGESFAPRREIPRVQGYQAPRKSNTAVVVLLTIIGTVLVLGIGGAMLYVLQQSRSINSNANVNSNLPNANLELNTNLNLDSNFNFNTSANANSNSNANLKTPTPTPKPSPSPTPSPTPEETVTPSTNTNSRPSTNTATPPPPTPRPTISPPSNRTVNGGVLNGRAINLSVPAYPTAARQLHASGQVTVQVLVDENGRVTAAKAINGHPLLRGAAESAARLSRINPLRIDNENVKTSGFLIYNFREN